MKRTILLMLLSAVFGAGIVFFATYKIERIPNAKGVEVKLRMQDSIYNQGANMGYQLGYNWGTEEGIVMGIKYGAVTQDNFWMGAIEEIWNTTSTFQDFTASVVMLRERQNHRIVQEIVWYSNDNEIKARLDRQAGFSN